MGTYIVAVVPPALDDCCGLSSISKPYHVETLVANPSVEALVGTILPSLARFVVRRTDALVRKPSKHCARYELGAVA